MLSSVNLWCTNSSSEMGKKGQNSDQSALALQGRCRLKSGLHLSEARFRHWKLYMKGERCLCGSCVLSLCCVAQHLRLRSFLWGGKLRKDWALSSRINAACMCLLTCSNIASRNIPRCRKSSTSRICGTMVSYKDREATFISSMLEIFFHLAHAESIRLKMIQG